MGVLSQWSWIEELGIASVIRRDASRRENGGGKRRIWGGIDGGESVWDGG